MGTNTEHTTPAAARQGTATAARRLSVAAVAALIALGAAACTAEPKTSAGAPSSTATATPAAPDESPTIEAPPPPASPSAPSAPADAVHTAIPVITIAGHGTSHLRLGPWTSKPARTLPGALYMREFNPAARYVQFSVLANGQRRTTTLHGTMPKYNCTTESAVISPNGRLVTWIEGEDTDRRGGTLIVAPLTTSGTTYGKIVATGIACAGGQHPMWMADSRRMLITKAATGQPGILDLRSGVFTAKPSSWSTYRAFSRGGGAFMAYGSNGVIVVETAAGKVVRRMPFSLGNRGPGTFAVQEVSADGRYVAVGLHNTDPQRFWSAPWIVDTIARKEIPGPLKPPAGGRASDVTFLASGGMLQGTTTREGATTLHLLNAARTVVASVPMADSGVVNAYVG